MLLLPPKPHVLVDLYACSPDRLNDLEGIRAVLIETARALGCTLVGQVFHQFSPYGVTGVLAIAESHLSVHTWVEEGYAAVDLFLCNSTTSKEELEAAVERVAQFFGAERSAVHAVQRGVHPAGGLALVRRTAIESPFVSGQ